MGSIEQHCVQFLSVARETRRTRGEEKVLVRGAGRWRGGRKWRKVDGRRARQVDKEGRGRLEARLGARGGEGGGGHGGRRGKTK